MLPLFCRKTALVVIALRWADARAVDANITSFPISTIPSSMPSVSTNVSIPSQSCTDLNNCRTLNQIIVSCLVTILACVWFAVHPNLPAPKPKPSQHPKFFVRTAQRAWSIVLDQREAAIVFFVALLAPEWILAWALRQAFRAWKLAGELEKARLGAQKAQETRYWEIVQRAWLDTQVLMYLRRRTRTPRQCG